MDRRKFLKKTTLAAGGVASGLYLSGCDSGGNGRIVGPDSGNGGNGNGGDDGNGGVSWDDWNGPLVNSRPYPSPPYSAAKDTTDEIGSVRFYDERRKETILNYFKSPSGKSISDLEVTMYRDYGRAFKDFLFVNDPHKEFMPRLTSLESHQSALIMNRRENSDRLINTTTGEISSGKRHPNSTKSLDYNLFIDEIIGTLPSYDPEDMDDLPGYVYIGDWSIDGLKNLNTILKYSSLVLAIPTKGATLKVYSVLDTIGTALDSIDLSAEVINSIHNSRQGGDLIDMSQDYSIYASLTGAQKLVLFPSIMASRGDEHRISDFFPIKEGNSWTFSDGRNRSTARVGANRRVKGEDLAVIEDVSGLEVYMGYNRDSLYQYGFRIPGEIGDIFFDPAIKVGDSKVKIGRSFPFKSNIIFKDLQDVSGSLEGKIHWSDRKNLDLDYSDLKYGDCYKYEEETTISLSGPGGSDSDTSRLDHWVAKNLWKVKVEFGEGQKIELVDTNINSGMEGFGLFKRALDKENYILASSLPEKIMEVYRKVR